MMIFAIVSSLISVVFLAWVMVSFVKYIEVQQHEPGGLLLECASWESLQNYTI